jgi:radical SAM protein with 4Fe4S-binding SPASM domain
MVKVNSYKNTDLYVDFKYNFITIFNKSTGKSIRSGIYKDGIETKEDPFMGEFPSLLDIGIMGTCHHKDLCTVGCYQGKEQQPNMSLEMYKSIINQSKGHVLEVALGGRGDPNKHPNFKEILIYTRENGIIPNYTTSGYNLFDDEISLTKEFCGAVAVSNYNKPYTEIALKCFIQAGIKTNIHYVLNKATIDNAIFSLQNNKLFNGINAIIFLMYKPVGIANPELMLDKNDTRIPEFFSLVDNWKGKIKLGFDSCTIPLLLNNTKYINPNSIDACDSSRFSAYISPDGLMMPCSFDVKREHALSLNEFSMSEIWNGDTFNKFRLKMKGSCPECNKRMLCLGGCQINSQINLCKEKL